MIKDNIIMLIGMIMLAILVIPIVLTFKPIEAANAETHVIKDPLVFKYLVEGHEYLSVGGNYIIHSESCSCRNGKNESEKGD